MNETILDAKGTDTGTEPAAAPPRAPQVRALRAGVSQFSVDLNVAARVRTAAAAVLGGAEGSFPDAAPLDPRGPGAEQYAILFMRLKEEFRVRVSGADAIRVETMGQLIALFENALGQVSRTDRVRKAS